MMTVFSRLSFSANFHSKSSLKFENLSTRKGGISAKILKNSSKAYLLELNLLSNNCLEKGVFPDYFKLADITSTVKKEDSHNKENHQPSSILLHFSKIFERILYKQLND